MTKSQTTKIQLRLRFACASNVVVVAAAYLVAADVVVVVADVVVPNAVETVNLVPSALNITKSELLGNILWAIRLMHIDISTRLRQGFLQKNTKTLKFLF